MISSTRNVLPPDDRRDLILQCASRVFAAKGYAGTKIVDIAEAAKMSQGLLYRYYTSKEVLFTELLRMSFEALNAAADGLEPVSYTHLDVYKRQHQWRRRGRGVRQSGRPGGAGVNRDWPTWAETAGAQNRPDQ